jgi:hypothetical protein
MAARDLTRREMGLLAGCSYGMIGFILDGRPCNPALARRISRVLRRSVDDLFQDAESNDEQSNDDSPAVA